MFRFLKVTYVANILHLLVMPDLEKTYRDLKSYTDLLHYIMLCYGYTLKQFNTLAINWKREIDLKMFRLGEGGQ